MNTQNAQAFKHATPAREVSGSTRIRTNRAPLPSNARPVTLHIPEGRMCERLHEGDPSPGTGRSRKPVSGATHCSANTDSPKPLIPNPLVPVYDLSGSQNVLGAPSCPGVVDPRSFHDIFTDLDRCPRQAPVTDPDARRAAVRLPRARRLLAGVAGDEARLNKAIELCERALEQNPAHAEALVWHGASLLVRASRAFQNGDMATGGPLVARGLKEMTDAVTMAPDNPGVLIPRAAVLLEATKGMPPDMARPMLESAVQNYERVLEIQAPTFNTRGDHAKGELLFGLAEGWSRLGDTDKARKYFERLIADAPTSGQTPKAREWMATGVVPKSNGASCVGCHK